MVVYWSQTGNVEIMTNAMTGGIREAERDAPMTEVSNISADALKGANIFALGRLAMGAEALEEGEADPLVAGVETLVSSEHIGLFDSYGRGDGEQTCDWQARTTNAGVDVVGGEGIIAQESPNEDALNHYRELEEVPVVVEV